MALAQAASPKAMLIGGMTWSIWYGFRGFRRRDEWGWAFVTPAPTAG